MSTKRYMQEQIVTLLRQIEVEIANGKSTPQACRVVPFQLSRDSQTLTLYLHRTLDGIIPACPVVFTAESSSATGGP